VELFLRGSCESEVNFGRGAIRGTCCEHGDSIPGRRGGCNAQFPLRWRGKGARMRVNGLETRLRGGDSVP
jgi:hypothetical protein